jgi:sporulation protein YlmC with PRC-barrel domain
MLMRAKDVIGLRIRATDGDIGHVRDLYVDEQKWVVRHVVVDTGQWLAGRRVLVSPRSIVGVEWRHHRLETALTRGQVRTSAAAETDKPVSRQHEIDSRDYVNLLLFWTDGERVSAIAPLAVSPPANHEGDPHLHSLRCVMNCTARAVDAEVGHVRDMVFDDESWAIDHIVVNMRRWLPGKRVLVPSASLASISWLELTVHLRLSADVVRGLRDRRSLTSLLADSAAAAETAVRPPSGTPTS